MHTCFFVNGRHSSVQTVTNAVTPNFVAAIIATGENNRFWKRDSEDNGTSAKVWARTLSRVRAPNSLPGGYANLLGPEEQDQIASAYGSNTSREHISIRYFTADLKPHAAITLRQLQGHSTAEPVILQNRHHDETR